MPQLLFEIGTEELPSWYVRQAKVALASLASERLKSAQLPFASLETLATPRRLALSVHGLAEASRSRDELKRGPAKEVAYHEDGSPSKALLGFAAANKVDPSDLIEQETDKGVYLFSKQTRGGEPAAELLPELLASLVTDLPAPRKMRWADVEVPFVRPVVWLLGLLDDKPLEFSVAGLRVGRSTRGHRFLAPDTFELPHAEAYQAALEERFVIADPERRAARTLEVAEEAASQENLTLVRQRDLLAEVSSLVEYPIAILGQFAAHYLELPEEVLATTMIHHQRFFPTRDPQGQLAPYFVGIANNRVPDPALVRQGFESVLDGRLADARFFWDADRRQSLSQHAWGLAGIGFHKELGSMADKMTRVEVAVMQCAAHVGLTEGEWENLKRALPVFRADLATQMVDELPELEGVMARCYALAEGYPKEAAEALEDGVRPSGPGAPLPASRIGALLAVTDRLDKLIGFFAIGQRPSGSTDPFGLRRDAIGLARILNHQGWELGLDQLLADVAEAYQASKVEIGEEVMEGVLRFIWDRVAGLLAEEGIPVELVRAAVDDNPPVITAARRAHLLRALSREPEFTDLLLLYKRAAKLAREADRETEVDSRRLSEAYELPLYYALTEAREALESLLARAAEMLEPWDLGRGPQGELRGLEQHITQLLALKGPLDAFLDNVLVMVDDEKLRKLRLALLREVRDTLHALGALEELEGV